MQEQFDSRIHIRIEVGGCCVWIAICVEEEKSFVTTVLNILEEENPQHFSAVKTNIIPSLFPILHAFSLTNFLGHLLS